MLASMHIYRERELRNHNFPRNPNVPYLKEMLLKQGGAYSREQDKHLAFEKWHHSWQKVKRDEVSLAQRAKKRTKSAQSQQAIRKTKAKRLFVAQQ